MRFQLIADDVFCMGQLTLPATLAVIFSAHVTTLIISTAHDLPSLAKEFLIKGCRVCRLHVSSFVFPVVDQMPFQESFMRDQIF